MHNKVYLTQPQFDNMVIELGRKVQKNRRFFTVYGIERGGIFISSPLSKYILADHRSIKISFYSDKDTLNPEPVYDFYNVDFDRLKQFSHTPILLVDDLIDTGSSLSWFINKTGMVQGKHFYFACLYYNKQNKHGLVPDFWVNEKKENEWIVFPHEIEREAKASA